MSAPTEKQQALLTKWNVPIPATKEEATAIIGQKLGNDKPQDTKPTDALATKLAYTKAFLDLMAAGNVNVEGWPACAGVFNASK